jgi:hypothetical protein
MRSGQIEIHVKGKPVRVPAAQIDGRTVLATGKWLEIATVQDEELTETESVADPESFISQLKKSGLNADIFTFSQKLWDNTPKYNYPLEWDNWAVIPITTYADWEKRAESSVRRAVRRAAKLGVVVKVAEFDDTFVKGIVNINNETPVRQGRAFWHFQKSFEAVKQENSTYPGRNTFLGAYLADELIGFVRIIHAGKVASLVQILSMMKHYDKRPTNALIAKAVEVCAEKRIPYLMYCNYVYNDPNSTLTEFKRRNGFEKVLVPRYYIPLTSKGKAAMKLGLHRGLTQRIPKPILIRLLGIRNSWYERKFKDAKESA